MGTAHLTGDGYSHKNTWKNLVSFVVQLPKPGLCHRSSIVNPANINGFAQSVRIRV
jgi:DNA-binding LytR/AlgR family response regulator